jgi:hypothetical protein
MFVQRFEADKVKQAIALHRATSGAAKLIARKRRFAGDIKVVRRVECVVTMELVRTAAKSVRARLGEHVDLAATHSAKLRAVRVGFDAELLNRFHP